MSKETVPLRVNGGLVLAGAVVVAFALRVLAADNDFWLDEVFTYYLTLEMTSVWDSFSKVRLDHHILNTVYIYLVGPRDDWIWYRAFSILSGAALIGLLAFHTWRRSMPEALAVVILAGLSYPLIIYSSEARGYAPAMFFSLLSFMAIQEHWRSRSILTIALFSLTTILALLSHLTAVYVYLAIGCWSLLYEYDRSRNLVTAGRELIQYHCLPLISIACLYIFIFSQSGSVGADRLSLLDVLLETLSLALGSPLTGAWEVPAAVVTLGIIACGIALLLKNTGHIWAFYLVVLLLAPALVLAIDDRGYVFVRYFVVSFPFFYLLFARVLAHAYTSVPGGKLIYVFTLMMASTGNLILFHDLTLYGRGSYLQAVTFMSQQTSGENIVVGSDHDFRNRMMLTFYERYLPPDKKISYAEPSAWPSGGVDWLILHDTSAHPRPASHVKAQGHLFANVRNYRSVTISGMNWFLYRKENSAQQEVE